MRETFTLGGGGGGVKENPNPGKKDLIWITRRR